MKLADLTPSDSDTTIEALHVILATGAPDRFLGLIGNNMFTVWRSPDFAEVIVQDDVIAISLTESGHYEATAKLGTRPGSDTEYLEYGLPWDYQQLGWDGGVGSIFYTGLGVLPVAMVVNDTGRGTDLAYGRVGGVDRTAVAYYGHSARWGYTGFDAEPARKISILLLEPNPAPVELTLLAGHYPGDASGVVDVPITPTLDYYGPHTPNVVDLPQEWIDALADGSAGSIQFGPSTTDPGFTHVAIGAARSLSLHT